MIRAHTVRSSPRIIFARSRSVEFLLASERLVFALGAKFFLRAALLALVFIFVARCYGATLGSASQQNLATARGRSQDRLLANETSFPSGARSAGAGGFAAFAFIFVDGDGVAFGTGNVLFLGARRLLAFPSFAASVRRLDEVMTSSVADGRYFLFARDSDASGASATVFPLLNSVLARLANVDGVVAAWFVLVFWAIALVENLLAVYDHRDHAVFIFIGGAPFLHAIKYGSFTHRAVNLLALAAFVALVALVFNVGADPLFTAAFEYFLTEFGFLTRRGAFQPFLGFLFCQAIFSEWFANSRLTNAGFSINDFSILNDDASAALLTLRVFLLRACIFAWYYGFANDFFIGAFGVDDCFLNLALFTFVFFRIRRCTTYLGAIAIVFVGAFEVAFTRAGSGLRTFFSHAFSVIQAGAVDVMVLGEFLAFRARFSFGETGGNFGGCLPSMEKIPINMRRIWFAQKFFHRDRFSDFFNGIRRVFWGLDGDFFDEPNVSTI